MSRFEAGLLDVGDWAGVLEQCIVGRVSAEAQQRSSGPTLSIEMLHRLVELCFWASLEHNEHRACVFRVALRSGEWSAIARFDPPQRLSTALLRKLASATASRAALGASLVVELVEGQWVCLGYGEPDTSADLWVDVLRPGVIRLSDLGGALAVMEGPRARFLGGLVTDSLAILKLLGGRPGHTADHQRATFLTQLLRDLSGQRTGGTLCIVPFEDRAAVLESLLEPLGLAAPEANRPSALIGREPVLRAAAQTGETHATELHRHLMELAATYARLAASDGAMALDAASLDLVCFGARIETDGPAGTTYETAELLPELTWQERPSEHVGGMRHRSALSLIAKHPSTVCFVCSADGPVSLFFAARGQGVRCFSRLDRLL